MTRVNLLEYFKEADTIEYDFVLKNLKPKNLFLGGAINFNKLSYQDVIICFDLISKIESKEALSDLFCLAYNVTDFYSASVEEFFSAKNYLIKSFSELKEKQINLLSSIDSDSHLWEIAGGKKLNKFNDLMPLVQLGEIYGIFPHDLRQRPYNEIFVLLVLHKEKNEVTNAYSKLKHKQK